METTTTTTTSEKRATQTLKSRSLRLYCQRTYGKTYTWNVVGVRDGGALRVELTMPDGSLFWGINRTLNKAIEDAITQALISCRVDMVMF